MSQVSCLESSVLILDFGSQYTQLIARRVREAHVYCEIWPCTKSQEAIEHLKPQGIILSGGPASVLEKDAPELDQSVLEARVPILGICYGMQSIAKTLDGQVQKASQREYGHAKIEVDQQSLLFARIKQKTISVWMSHGDHVIKLPKGFQTIGKSVNAPIAAMSNPDRKIYALQFHPEVKHTPDGKTILENFLFQICQIKPNWTMTSFIDSSIKTIQDKVGKAHVVLGLSGGVDSSVAALLIHKAIGDQLHCIFVDNGLLRKDEVANVEQVFKTHFHIPLTIVHAEDRFLKNLKGVEDPEKKRKIIGHEFIAVFDDEAKQIPNVKFLAQGTLYPDVIESVSFRGPSAVIKSHHNVGGLPEKMNLTLLEPFRELFKDEVREVGRTLGLPAEIVDRHPFPGPGLAVRILGEITLERLNILREADAIMMGEVRKAKWYDKMWQGFCVLLPVQSVGVMGDERTYENVLALRCVQSTDGMTADWVHLPYDLLGKISNRIINEVKGINRVVYDISSKPPATIEWE